MAAIDDFFRDRPQEIINYSNAIITWLQKTCGAKVLIIKPGDVVIISGTGPLEEDGDMYSFLRDGLHALGKLFTVVLFQEDVTVTTMARSLAEQAQRGLLPKPKFGRPAVTSDPDTVGPVAGTYALRKPVDCVRGQCPYGCDFWCDQQLDDIAELESARQDVTSGTQTP